MPELSRRVQTFTDSVIRRMTRISDEVDAINLSQGFPDFPPPKAITDRLREVADELKKQFGDELPYRMGGDEYVAFAPDLSEDRLHEKVRTFSLAIEQKDYHAALGWATCETASLRMENLLRIAETRMYQAKSAYYQDKNILPRGR